MKRTQKEMIEKNIELSTEFSRYLFDHADLYESIPPEADIVFLPEFDPELKKFNLELGKKLISDGNKVVYIKIERLRPKILSRIEGVSLYQ
ncbi:MAG: hypothetical protein KKE59_09485 [Proteobacteria bacterium]|jgi:hypothetical protein|nr:hypothetical protein [Pseudomonadota bacterium]